MTTFYSDRTIPIGERLKPAPKAISAGADASAELPAKLDVAVIGNDAAAKVFVAARTPVAVAIPTAPGRKRPGLALWLLLLIVIAAIVWFVIRRMRTAP